MSQTWSTELENNNEATAPSKFTMEELSRLTGISRRTIRYYIQRELVSPPEGEKRGSFYTHDHLEQLLRVKRLTEKHIPLAEIPSFDDKKNSPLAQEIGSISFCTHISLGAGLELVVDPGKAGLSAKQLRLLAADFLKAIENVKNQ